MLSLFLCEDGSGRGFAIHLQVLHWLTSARVAPDGSFDHQLLVEASYLCIIHDAEVTETSAD